MSFVALVTQGEKMASRWATKPRAKAPARPVKVLTDAEILTARRMYAAGGKVRGIASKFGVSENQAAAAIERAGVIA